MNKIRTTMGGPLLLLLSTLLFENVLVSSYPVFPRHCQGNPKHIHIAVGRDPSREMTVSFSSKWAKPGVKAPLGGIHVGTSPQKLDRFVGEQEFPLTYNTSLPFERWGHYYAPFQHHITIDSLQPNTTYYYAVVVGRREEGIEHLRDLPIRFHESQHVKTGSYSYDDEDDDFEQDDDEQILSEEELNSEEENYGRRDLSQEPYDGHDQSCTEGERVRSFRTAPETHPDQPVSFAIVGDLGQFEFSQRTVEHMKAHKHEFDAAFLVGDIAYTQNDDRRWDTFFDFLDDHSCFDEIPLAIATGNHDIEKQKNGKEIFRAYENRFRMPRVRPPQLGLFEGDPGKLNMDHAPYPMPYDWGNAYYPIEYGSAKILVVSAYSNMDPDSTQYKWLYKQLANTDRTKTPWLMVVMHVPMYNTFNLHHHDLQIVAAREHIQPLLVKFRANMIFSGHIHAYQRTSNIIENAQRHPQGPIHITIGAGGRACSAPFTNVTAEAWIEQRDATMYGYGKFQIYNSTDAEWIWVPVAESDTRSYNYVKRREDVHLPSVKEDGVWVKNQHFL